MIVSGRFAEVYLGRITTDPIPAYGDMNLFCSCGPVETVDTVDGITGVAAPAPT